MKPRSLISRGVAASIVFALVGIANAQVIDKNYESGSLWSNHTTNPFLDRTARKVGDLVTIIISESSAASFSAATNTKKEDSNKLNNAFVNSLLSRLFPNVQTGASSSNSGSGTSTQGGSVTAKLTAVVKQVMPGGALMIEGTRTVVVNKEIQSFKLSGIVRRDDIRSDNSILSENIAEADIKMEGKGAIYDRQRRGLLTRLLDWLF
jgi:flagellar L-ring protein FlgH